MCRAGLGVREIVDYREPHRPKALAASMRYDCQRLSVNDMNENVKYMR
jgi:hypothetical protein